MLGRRLRALVLCAALLTGCSTTAPDAARPSPTPTIRPVVDKYAALVLTDAPSAFWPLGDSTTSAAALGQPAMDATGKGVPWTTGAGPVLVGQPRPAAEFSGHSRLISPLLVAAVPTDTWSVDFWLRSSGCGTTYERIAGNSVLAADGRSGIDVFHYPAQARAPCQIGAELWSRDRFLGGCASVHPPVPGVWQHFAVTRSTTTTSCYVDGALVNRRSGRGPTVVPGTGWGIAGSGSGYGAALQGGLAGLAVYPRVLPPARVLAHARA